MLPRRHPKNTVRNGPEAKGAMRLRNFMIAQGWGIIKLHGSMYLDGMPDLLCMHCVYGMRWVETKAPGEKLRLSQLKRFTYMKRHGEKIYVLENETHYDRLFKKPNWEHYI